MNPALSVAISNDDVELLKKQIRTAREGNRIVAGKHTSLVHRVALLARPRILAYLISIGCDFSNALYHALSHHESAPCVRILLEAGAIVTNEHMNKVYNDGTEHQTTWMLVQCSGKGVQKEYTWPHWMHLMFAHREERRAVALAILASPLNPRDIARLIAQHVWALRCVWPANLVEIMKMIPTGGKSSRRGVM